MDEKELKNLEKASDFQNEVVGMLKSLGYRYKYNLTYYLSDVSMDVDVSKIYNIGDLFIKAYKNGAQDKVWEIKRVLEV